MSPGRSRRAPPAPDASWPSAWSYFALAYAWSWTFWITAAATVAEGSSFATVVLFALGGIGPVVSASVLTTRGGGAAARRALLRSAVAFRRSQGAGGR